MRILSEASPVPMPQTPSGLTPSNGADRPEERTAPLDIRLFGTFDVCLHGQPLGHMRSPRAGQYLLALLVLRHDREVERTWLAATLWPDSLEGQALYNLNRNLTHLRHALGPQASRLLSPTSRTLLLDLKEA